MRYVGALGLLLSLAYLLWRVQTTRRFVERIPFVLDIAAACGAGGVAFGWLADIGTARALMVGAVLAAGMAAALLVAHAIAAVVGLVPGFHGVHLDIPLDTSDREEAIRWLRFRTTRSGYRVERPRAGADFQAYQGGNPSAWDRKERPKRLRAWLEATPAGLVARVHVRYLPPAMGGNRLLRPVVDEITSPGAEPLPEARTTRLAVWVPVELLIVLGILFFFAAAQIYTAAF